MCHNGRLSRGAMTEIRASLLLTEANVVTKADSPCCGYIAVAHAHICCMLQARVNDDWSVISPPAAVKQVRFNVRSRHRSYHSRLQEHSAGVKAERLSRV